MTARETVEIVADRYNVSREDQDADALHRNSARLPPSRKAG